MNFCRYVVPNRRLCAAVLLTALALVLCLQPGEALASDTVKLIKPPVSGDGQVGSTGALLPKPFRVRAETADGRPVPGLTVRFSVAAAPSGATGAGLQSVPRYDTSGAGLEFVSARTDGDGWAEVRLRLGSKGGDYLVSAAAPESRAVVVFTASARASNWLFTLFVGLAGGLGIFLFGLRIMSDGMKKTAAGRIRSILSKLTYNRFVAVAAGAFVTVLMQSSSATTVMLVSFVRAGLMSFAQSIGIILGADIGTTITAQLIAFRLTDYALLVIGVGIALSLLAKRDGPKNVGEAILGFGLLFFGMDIMSMSMAPLQTHAGFIDLLVALENPLLAILTGAAFTALIQSSGAFAGILIVLGSQGLITLEAAIPLLFGANIGTCVTAGLACIGTNRDAQRVALAHVLIKVAGVLLFVWWIPQFADLVRRLSPGDSPAFAGDLLPRQIANAHTIFNVALTAALLPFTNVAARLITRLLPDSQHEEPPPYQTWYLDDALLGTPALALNLAKAEVIHMGGIVAAMVEKVIQPFTLRDRGVIEELKRDEEAVNFLEDAIQRYLRAISRESVGRDRVTEVFQMMYTVTELEQIGDIIAKSLVPRARGWLDGDLRFSPEGELELKDYHLRTVKQLSRAISVFQNVNLEAASRMKKKHRKYRKMEEQYLRSHFDRILREVPQALKSSEYHQDLMEQFRRITSHSTRIARIFLHGEEELVKKGDKEQSPPRL